MVAVACPVPTAAQLRPAASSALGWGSSGATARVDRMEPDACGADQTGYGGSQKRRPVRSTCSGKVDLLRQGDSFSKHRQATYFMMPVIGAR